MPENVTYTYRLNANGNFDVYENDERLMEVFTGKDNVEYLVNVLNGLFVPISISI